MTGSCTLKLISVAERETALTARQKPVLRSVHGMH